MARETRNDEFPTVREPAPLLSVLTPEECAALKAAAKPETIAALGAWRFGFGLLPDAFGATYPEARTIILSVPLSEPRWAAQRDSVTRHEVAHALARLECVGCDLGADGHGAPWQDFAKRMGARLDYVAESDAWPKALLHEAYEAEALAEFYAAAPRD